MHADSVKVSCSTSPAPWNGMAFVWGQRKIMRTLAKCPVSHSVTSVPHQETEWETEEVLRRDKSKIFHSITPHQQQKEEVQNWLGNYSSVVTAPIWLLSAGFQAVQPTCYRVRASWGILFCVSFCLWGNGNGKFPDTKWNSEFFQTPILYIILFVGRKGMVCLGSSKLGWGVCSKIRGYCQNMPFHYPLHIGMAHRIGV